MTDFPSTGPTPSMPLSLRLRAEINPFARLIAAITLLATAWALWVVPFGWATPAWAFLAVVGAALGVIDARTQRLPNAIVLPSYPVLAALLVIASAGTTATDLTGWAYPGWSGLVRAILGGSAAFGAYFVLWWINPRGLGFGDVKLAGLLGSATAWFGWQSLFVANLTAFVLAAVVGLVLIVSRRATRHTAIPFGPFMLAGTMAAVTLTRMLASA